jgi:hypothetical protein
VPSLVTSIIGGIQGASAAHDAASEISKTGISNADLIKQALAQALSHGEAGMTQGNEAIGNALKDALSQINQGVGSGNAALQKNYDTEMGNLSPYLGAGQQGVTQLADLLKPGGALMQDFQWNPANDPGFQFRMNEGAKALQASAAAHGGALGGAAAKRMQRYAQDYGSGEFQKAYERFNTDRAAKFGMLSGLAGIGQTANAQAINVGNNWANNTSDNLMKGALTGAGLTSEAGSQISRNDMQGNQWLGQMGMMGTEAQAGSLMDAAKARAAGHLGAAQAWNGMLSGIGSGLNGALFGGFGGGGGFDWGGALSGVPKGWGPWGSQRNFGVPSGGWGIPSAPIAIFPPGQIGQPA